MKITQKAWIEYKNKLSAISKKASDELTEWIEEQGGLNTINLDEMTAYTYGLTKKYGEASAALSATMYDSVAEASGAATAAAEVAATASYPEVAASVQNIVATSKNADYVGGVAGRLVKQAGADTTLKNAARDGAECAWIPTGDTCAYCLSVAAEGWQRASKATLEGVHADHIHANCDCEFMIRFNEETTVSGYDPDKYKEIYDSAEGETSAEKINYLRREFYAENKEEINEQKRISYARRTEELNSSAAEEYDLIFGGRD